MTGPDAALPPDTIAHPVLWAEVTDTLPRDRLAGQATWTAILRHAGWGQGFADRVLGETQRVLYLALLPGAQVVPPQPVAFCLDLLARVAPEAAPLLQRAGAGILRPAPVAEDGLQQLDPAEIALAAPYARTRADYEAAFGAPPDPEVWHDEDPADVHLWIAHRLGQPRRGSRSVRTGVAMAVLFWGGAGSLWLVDGRGPDPGVGPETLVFLGAMGAMSALFAGLAARAATGPADATALLAYGAAIRQDFLAEQDHGQR